MKRKTSVFARPILGCAILMGVLVVLVWDARPTQKAATSSIPPVWSLKFAYDGVSIRDVQVAAAGDGGAFLLLEVESRPGVLWPVVSRLDARGRVLWQRDFGGIHNESYYTHSLLAMQDGGCLIAYGKQPRLIKLSENGTVAWSKVLGSPEGKFYFVKLAPAANGDFYAAGQFHELDYYRCLFVSRFNSSGDPVWSRRSRSPELSLLEASPLASGGIVVGGWFYSQASQKTGAWIVVFNGQGEPLWEKAFESSDTLQLDGLYAREDGGIFLAFRHWNNAQWTATAAMRIDGLGDVVWQRTFDTGRIAFRRGYGDGGDSVVTTDKGLLVLLPDGRIQEAKPLASRSSIRAATMAAEGGYFLAGDDFLMKTDTRGIVGGCEGSSEVGSASNPETAQPFNMVMTIAPFFLGISSDPSDWSPSPLAWSLVCRDPNYLYLTMRATEGGATEPPPGVAGYDRGAIIAVEAIPEAYYDFLDWIGDAPEGFRQSPAFPLTMSGDKTLQPRFLKIQAPLNLTGSRLLGPMRPWAFDVLTWTPHPENQSIEKYRIFSVVDGVETLLGEVPADALRFVNRKAPRGETVQYAVCAVTASGREGVRAQIEVR